MGQVEDWGGHVNSVGVSLGIDLADRDIKSSSHVLGCLVGFWNDTHTFGNSFGSDGMIPCYHDYLGGEGEGKGECFRQDLDPLSPK